MQALPPEIAWSHIPFTSRFDLLRWYAACDAVAIPSLYDGMPNVLLEAGALGIPVLGSSAGGLADVLADGQLTFAPGDLHACRRALDMLLEMPAATLRALGAELLQTVRQRFEQQHEATRYHEVLADTAAHVSPRRETAIVSMENEQ